MDAKSRKTKGSKGSVQFKNTKGRQQIVFSYPIEVDGEVKRKRCYISTGYDAPPINRYRVSDIVRQLQRDIDYGEVDLTLEKYKPIANVSMVSSGFPNSPNSDPLHECHLSDLWAKYSNFQLARQHLRRTSPGFAIILRGCQVIPSLTRSPSVTTYL